MGRQQRFGEPRGAFTVAARGAEALDALGYRDVAVAFADRRGEVVRSTPFRCTVTQRVDERVAYVKRRSRRPQDARNEWRCLFELAALGVPVPEPLFVGFDGRRSVLAIGAVPGAPLHRLLATIADRDPTEFVRRRVAPVVRRLHAAGWVHRDLYWTHLFATDLDPDGPPVAVIDVERAFRPRWRRRRWLVKDLAGLVSSWPGAMPARLGLLALRDLGVDREFVPEILAKARRIAGHRPKHVGDTLPAWWAPPPGGGGEGSVRSP